MKRNILPQSIFFKLLTVFFSVILVLLTIGFGIFYWGIDTINEKIISEACVQNRSFSDDLDREFKRIIMLQYDLVDNWDLMRISTSLADKYNEYDKSVMILRIKEKINAIKTSSKMISEIKVIVPYINKSIETVSVMDIDSSSFDLIKNYQYMDNKQLLYYKNSLLLISEYPEMYYKKEIPVNYLMHTTISKQNLIQYLKERNSYTNSKTFIFSKSRDMLISNDNEIMAQRIMDSINKEKNKMVPWKKDSVEDTYFMNTSIDGNSFLVIYTETGIQDFKLVRYISENDAYGGLVKYKVSMWIFAISALIIIFIFSKSLYQTIHAPLKKLVNAFKKVQKGNFSVVVKHKKNDEFKYIYDGFNEMVYKLDDLIDQVYKQKLLAEKAKLKQLQAQINPHFLYNSFLILSNRIQIGDNAFAEEFCKNLGSYFMFVTRNKKDFVSLSYETQHAITYANIQCARFSSRLDIEIEQLPEEFENIQVPRLILQPILENAFEHTLENMESGGYLSMSYKRNGDYLDIIVEDNGIGLEDNRLNELREMLNQSDIETTGMINIHQRLKLTYNDECGLILDRSTLGGLKVIVRLLLEGLKEG